MSKIVSPFPPLLPGEDYRPPAGARWWRFRMRNNAEGNKLIMRNDGEMNLDTGEVTRQPTWCEYEFFDDCDTVIDTGLDGVLPVVITHREFGPGWIDVLHVGAPTPSPHWEAQPFPGYWPHPESSAYRARFDD